MTNRSDKAHSLQVSLADSSVLVDAPVSSCADGRPSVWKRFDLGKATRRLTVAVDGERKVVELGKHVKEVVIGVGQGVVAIHQDDALVPWR